MTVCPMAILTRMDVVDFGSSRVERAPPEARRRERSHPVPNRHFEHTAVEPAYNKQAGQSQILVLACAIFSKNVLETI